MLVSDIISWNLILTLTVNNKCQLNLIRTRNHRDKLIGDQTIYDPTYPRRFVMLSDLKLTATKIYFADV